jgi:hypothetical protein
MDLIGPIFWITRLSDLTVPPLRRLTFGRRPKSKQKVLPLASGPTSSGALVPSLLQGPAYKGRPWPFTPFAASMRLTPLHNDFTRPPEWGGWRRLWNWGLKARHVASAVRLRFDKHKRVAVMAASGVFNHQGGQGARCPSWLSINACRFGSSISCDLVDLRRGGGGGLSL